MSEAEKTALLCLPLCFLLYLGFALPLIPVAVDDIRMANVFSIDEADIAAEVRRLYRAGFLEAPSFKYGGFFYYLPLLTLKLWGLFGAVTDRLIILTLRTFCTVAGAGCLWLTYRIGCIVFDRMSGLIGVFLLLVSPIFLRWSVESHPDLPQLFWLLWGLLCCCRLCRMFSVKDVVLASVFAGLAFGTKYSGVFLLPVIALGVLLPDEAGGLSLRVGVERLRQGRYWVWLVMIPVVFVLAFGVTNPYALMRFDAFRESLLAEKAIMDFGHTFRADTRGVLWLEMLWGLMGYAHAAVFAVYVLWGGWSVVKDRRLSADRGLLLVWVVIFLGYLMIEVNLRRLRHLLPVLPVVVLFAGEGYRYAGAWMRERFSVWIHRVVVPVLVVVFSWSQVSGSVDLFGGKFGRVEGKVELVVGRWLGEVFPVETTILFDAYAYIPGKFRNVYRSFGISYPMVTHFEPDLLVIRQAIANDFKNREDAARSRRKEKDFLDRHFFYKYLQEGLIPDYKRVRGFGSVTVYKRSASKVRGGANPSELWQRLRKHYSDGRAYGVSEARRTMGDIHASFGLEDLAEQEYARARKTKNYAVRLYNLACKQLAEGKFQEARRAFNEIATMIVPKPADYRAAIHRDIARQYFETGYYREAVVEEQNALRLKPDLREAHFELAAAYLGSGNVERADSAYAEAVKRYGADPEAADALRMLGSKGISADAARRMLTVHFGFQ